MIDLRKDSESTILLQNTSTTPLNNGQTFTGEAEQPDKNGVYVQLKTDQSGILTVQFSPDGTNWDTTLTYNYYPDRIFPIEPFNNPNKRFVRVSFTNDSGSNQTEFRLYTYSAPYNTLNSSINSTLSETFPAQVVRTTDYYSEVAMSKRQGRKVWNKFGYNGSVNSGTTEIVASWSTAFSPVTGIMASAQTYTITYNATTDGQGRTGALSLLITHIDSNFQESTETHTLGATGSDVTSFSGYGINRVIVLSNGGLGWNANDITITATTDGTTQAQVPAQGSVTQQCLFHTQINHTFLADYLRFKILKPSGGGSGNGYLIGYSWSRVTNTRYEVFRESYTTSSTTDALIELKPSQKFQIGGLEVLYFVLEVTNGNNTRVEGRFSGIEERNN